MTDETQKQDIRTKAERIASAGSEEEVAYALFKGVYESLTEIRGRKLKNDERIMAEAPVYSLTSQVFKNYAERTSPKSLASRLIGLIADSETEVAELWSKTPAIWKARAESPRLESLEQTIEQEMVAGGVLPSEREYDEFKQRSKEKNIEYGLTPDDPQVCGIVLDEMFKQGLEEKSKQLNQSIDSSLFLFTNEEDTDVRCYGNFEARLKAEFGASYNKDSLGDAWHTTGTVSSTFYAGIKDIKDGKYVEKIRNRWACRYRQEIKGETK